MLIKGDCHNLKTQCQNMTINQSLANGLRVLLLFDVSDPLLTVAEISKRLNYSQSKTYRMVRTLIQHGFLEEVDGSAKYSPGLNALRLGFLAQQRFNLSVIARPFMKELCSLTKETVFLTTVNGTRGICLERVESDDPIRWTAFQPGQEIPLHCGAPSKLLMASLSEEDWDRVIKEEGLKQYTPNTITNINKLKAQLKEIREKECVFSDQELYRGVRAVAAPILNGIGEVVAALSIAGPVYRINKKKLRFLGKLVVQYAQKISSQLGYKFRTEKSTEA
jgi:DNA-binding IclR family transcriptional regulator